MEDTLQLLSVDKIKTRELIVCSWLGLVVERKVKKATRRIPVSSQIRIGNRNAMKKKYK